jgi:hypothetical protein
MVGRQWGITDEGGTRCGRRLGAERREEKKGGERFGEARGWCSPFIGAGEGHTRERKGEMADGNGLNAIEGGAA